MQVIAKLPDNVSSSMSPRIFDHRFADVVLPMVPFDPTYDHVPMFKSFYHPALKKTLLSFQMPEYLWENAAALREDIIANFASKFSSGQEIKAFHRWDGMNFRLSTHHDFIRGWYVSCRRVASPLPRLDQIRGLTPNMAKYLLKVIGSGHGGLIFFVGKSGVGKTTTMFSALREALLTFGGTAYTVENPPEIPISGIHGPGELFQLDASRTSMTKELAEVRRKGNQYGLVGEIQFADEAVETLLGALDGQVVFASGHGDSIIGGLERLASTLSEKRGRESSFSLLGTALRAVIYQRKGQFNASGEWTFECDCIFFDRKDSQPAGGKGSGVPERPLNTANGLIKAGKIDLLTDDIANQMRRLELTGSPF